MPKAGLFAGEVTPQAPADGAATLKQKGYQWMEYGAAPAPFVPMSTGGIAGTQYESGLGPTFPDLTHPLAGETFSEFTMTYLGAITTPPSLQDDVTRSNAFQLTSQGGEHLWVSMARVNPGRYDHQFQLGTQIDTEAVGNGALTIPDANILDWWCFMVSYKESTQDCTYWATNIETGQEIQGTTFLDGISTTIEFQPKELSDGTGFSICHWGFGILNTFDPLVLWRVYKGYLSQVTIHNKYVDFSQSANRRKFCALDGAVDYGATGEIPYGERPMIYFPNGHPSSSVGTKFVGNWDEDFYVKTELITGPVPPIGT